MKEKNHYANQELLTPLLINTFNLSSVATETHITIPLLIITTSIVL